MFARGQRRARVPEPRQLGAAGLCYEDWRIYEVDPLLCPRCRGPLSMVAVITEQKVVTAILRHLDKHDQPTSVHARDPPAA